MKLLVTVVLVFLISCVSCIREEVGERIQYIQPGDELPDFTVTMNDGTVLDRNSLEGKVSVLVFFHTSCPDCQRELPVVQKLYEHLQGDSRVVIVCISREEAAGEVASYWLRNALTLPYSAQPDRKVYSLFAEEGIPLIYISDEACRVQYLFTDDPTASYDDLYQAVSAMVD